jgi:hypothetical protein
LRRAEARDHRELEHIHVGRPFHHAY